MAPLLSPLFRFVKSMSGLISTFFGFAFILTSIFILQQPSPGPGVIQRLGWQSWDVITMPTQNYSSAESSNVSGTGSSDPPNGTEQVDWWNVTAPESGFDASTLPLDVWAPLLPHNTGCTSDDTVVQRNCLTRLFSVRNHYHQMLY